MKFYLYLAIRVVLLVAIHSSSVLLLSLFFSFQTEQAIQVTFDLKTVLHIKLLLTYENLLVDGKLTIVPSALSSLVPRKILKIPAFKYVKLLEFLS